VTRRLSVRGEGGFGWMAPDARGLRDDRRRLLFSVNLACNRERGAWRPFVTGGLGVYRYTSRLSDSTLLDPVLRNALIGLGLDPSLNDP
jgi:hypothetical protein